MAGLYPLVPQNTVCDYIALSVPDSPRESFSSTAGGNTSLVPQSSFPVPIALPVSEIPLRRASDMANVQQIENLVHDERAAVYNVLHNQREGF